MVATRGEVVGFTPPASDARTGAGGFAVVGGGEGIVVWILKAAWVRGFLVVGGERMGILSDARISECWILEHGGPFS